MLCALLVIGQVQREDAGQDQQVVLAGGDVHRVDVGRIATSLRWTWATPRVDVLPRMAPAEPASELG